MERLSFLPCYSIEPEFLLSTKGRVKKLRELVKNERKGRASWVSDIKLKDDPKPKTLHFCQTKIGPI